MAAIEKSDAAKTTSEITVEYINEHFDIKNCLKKGIINYSALARVISEDCKISKKSSMEAILVAARRYQTKLKKELSYDAKIQNILKNSSIEVKTKISVFILQKDIDVSYLNKIMELTKKESGIFYLIEGSDCYTLITQEKYCEQVLKVNSSKIIQKASNLVLVNYISPKDIEFIPGVISYITSRFTENGINIVEMFSCWTDTLFVINAKDLNKVISFLNL